MKLAAQMVAGAELDQVETAFATKRCGQAMPRLRYTGASPRRSRKNGSTSIDAALPQPPLTSETTKL